MDDMLLDEDEASGAHAVECTVPLDDDGAAADSSELSPEFADRLAVLAQLAGLYRKGEVSFKIIEAWKRHVSDNRLVQASKCSWEVNTCVKVETDDNRRLLLKGAIAEFFQHNPVRVTETLGDNLRAAFFTGPHMNTIIISSDVVQNQADLTFQAMELFMHYVTGQLKGGSYDFMPEFRRDRRIPAAYLTPRFGDFEGKARNATCCLWDDAYSESVLERSFVRTALRQPGVTPQFFREAVRDKPGFRTSFVRQLLGGAIGTSLRNRVHVPPVYGGPVAIVKAPDCEDINVYLLQRVRHQGEREDVICRRWIPSERVLQCLGVSLDDVVRIPWDQLMQYDEEGILIDPTEVAQIQEVLRRTISYSVANVLLNGQSRLRGLFDKTSVPTPIGWGGATFPPFRAVPTPLHLSHLGRM
jgi:hypothetical protein